MVDDELSMHIDHKEGRRNKDRLAFDLDAQATREPRKRDRHPQSSAAQEHHRADGHCGE